MSKILVIDDNKLVSLMLSEHLNLEGYEVALAEDANQGYASAIEFQPDLILLDVQLPDVIGFDLIRIIKNRDDLRHIPIMMITGTAHSTAEKVKGFQLGADDYVLKPFEIPELLERIKALLRRSTARPAEAVHPEPALPPVEPAAIPSQAISEWPMRRVVETLLFSPLDLPRLEHYPPVSMLFLALALALGYTGLASAAGPAVKPALMTVAVLGSWGVAVSVLVMSTSVLGVPMAWKIGARLFSLAAIPLLLKMAAAAAVSGWTTLSPFYFQAGPSLFVLQPSFWLQRVDLFEIWSVLLLWVLVRVQLGSNVRKSTGVVTCVWAVGLLLAWAVQNVAGVN